MPDLDLLPAELAGGDVPEWADELDVAIAAGAELPEPAVPWVPTNDGAAEWAARKLAALTARKVAVANQAAAWHTRIAEWEADERARVEPGIAFFEGRLLAYGLAMREVDGRATVRIPTAIISTRQPKTATVEVGDVDAFVAWAVDVFDGDEYEEVVKTTVEPRVMEIRKRVTTELTTVRFCKVCGAEVVPAFAGDDVDTESWEHRDAMPDVADDHDAVAVTRWVVMYDGTEVPGLVAEMRPATASISINR